MQCTFAIDNRHIWLRLSLGRHQQRWAERNSGTTTHKIPPPRSNAHVRWRNSLRRVNLDYLPFEPEIFASLVYSGPVLFVVHC